MVTLLYFDDCPNWQIADQHLRALADEIGFAIERVEVTTPDQAERLRFRGSPSMHIDGVDLFADADAPVGLSCRIYQTPEGSAGSPTADQLRAALAHTSAPPTGRRLGPEGTTPPTRTL
jgi:hypothetical protein